MFCLITWCVFNLCRRFVVILSPWLGLDLGFSCASKIFGVDLFGYLELQFPHILSKSQLMAILLR